MKIPPGPRCCNCTVLFSVRPEWDHWFLVQSTSWACQLARLHKPGRSSVPTDVTPLLPEYSSDDKR